MTYEDDWLEGYSYGYEEGYEDGAREIPDAEREYEDGYQQGVLEAEQDHEDTQKALERFCYEYEADVHMRYHSWYEPMRLCTDPLCKDLLRLTGEIPTY